MITDSYIMKLVKDYANSPEGRRKIKEKYGIDYKDSAPQTELLAYGKQMKQVLYKYVSGVIKSITLDDIIVGNPKKDVDGQWSLEISFREGSLRRESLDSDYFPEGISNIVLLFAKGYRASNYVYGLWDITGKKDYRKVRSRKERESNDFLERAVNEFNSNHGNDVARAELLGAYKNN